ncbi:MAG: hypothetical protein HKN82_15985 [Akkermansiaceae bacterium]|nr:hypothetical protein [Akkermansiaceae bacterium]NNM29675.1 hypothetical protein [Akkermansiaceae bacterium]
MCSLRSILPAALAALGIAAAPAQEVVVRHSLTVAGIEEVPKTYDVEAIGLTTEVIVVDDGTPILKKRPGTAEAEGLTFFIPEIGDEVVVFFNWWTRIATTGVAEPHDADIIGFNADGDPVVRWHFENAWPSRLAGPTLRNDAAAPGRIADLRVAVTLQADRIEILPVDGVAPWPDIVDLSTDPRANTFRMTWRSVAGATYSVFRWDARSEKFVTAANVTAPGDLASYTRPMAGSEIFYVLLTSAPPPVGP